MKSFHAAALITTTAVCWFLLQACAHSARTSAPTRPAWTLSGEAHDDDLFCVIIPRTPVYPPESTGLRCARVGDLRMWLGHLKYGH